MPSLTLLHIALLALLLGGSGCDQSSSPAATPVAAKPAAPAPPPGLVGQFRNMEGTWRFSADGTFWFIGGTTIQQNPTGVAIPRSEQLSGKYEARGDKLHFKLKQHTPDEKDVTFQIDGDKLTIDGIVYNRQVAQPVN